MGIPKNLPQEIVDCNNDKCCKEGSHLECFTFLAGRSLHLKNKMHDTEKSLEGVESDQVLAMKQAEMQNISIAIAQLGDGTYGICKKCKCQIPKKRLLALPDALTCVVCA